MARIIVIKKKTSSNYDEDRRNRDLAFEDDLNQVWPTCDPR